MVKDSAVNATASAVGDAAATVVTIAVASTPAAPAAVAAGTVVGVGAIRNADFSKMAKNVGDLRRKTHYKIRNRHRRHKQPIIV